MQECGPGLITRDAFEEIKDEVKKKAPVLKYFRKGDPT